MPGGDPNGVKKVGEELKDVGCDVCKAIIYTGKREDCSATCAGLKCKVHV